MRHRPTLTLPALLLAIAACGVADADANAQETGLTAAGSSWDTTRRPRMRGFSRRAGFGISTDRMCNQRGSDRPVHQLHGPGAATTDADRPSGDVRTEMRGGHGGATAGRWRPRADGPRSGLRAAPRGSECARLGGLLGGVD